MTEKLKRLKQKLELQKKYFLATLNSITKVEKETNNANDKETNQTLTTTPLQHNDVFPENIKCPQCRNTFEIRNNLKYSMCKCGYVHDNSTKLYYKTSIAPELYDSKVILNFNEI